MSDEAVASQLEALGFWVGSPALVAASIMLRRIIVLHSTLERDKEGREAAEARVRATVASSPPRESIQSSCWSMRKRVATEGVL